MYFLCYLYSETQLLTCTYTHTHTHIGDVKCGSQHEKTNKQLTKRKMYSFPCPRHEGT